MNDYVGRLRSQACNCDFESLKQSENLQESMVINQLICGVNSKQFQEKILQSAALKTPTVIDIVSLVDNLQQVNQLCGHKEASDVLAVQHSSKPTTVSRKCPYCGNSWHLILVSVQQGKLTANFVT